MHRVDAVKGVFSMKKMTLISVVLLFLTVVGPLFCSVPQMINYQGKLMQPSGVPVADGAYSMQFAIYDAPTGGTALWSETNSNVQVKGGFFSVLLGSVKEIPGGVFDGASRYFGVTVGTDQEMTPRQMVTSVGYAVKAGMADIAIAVPDSSISTAKLASSVVTSDKLAAGAVTTVKLAQGSVTADRLAPGVAVPPGTILMWSGAATSIPNGWTLCNGTNGSPNLQGKFVVGVGSDGIGQSYGVGVTGGESFHKLTSVEMPSHNHTVNTPEGIVNWGGNTVYGIYDGALPFSGEYMHRNVNPITTNAGGDQPHENRPPYYALCYIMKLPY